LSIYEKGRPEVVAILIYQIETMKSKVLIFLAFALVAGSCAKDNEAPIQTTPVLSENIKELQIPANFSLAVWVTSSGTLDTNWFTDEDGNRNNEKIY